MHESSLTLPPLSLYIHIPWCVRKCPYCDFNSHAAGTELPEDAYVQALINDLDIEETYVQGRKLSSIFLGGGTPSLFSIEAIGRVIQAAKRRIGFEENIEITLEANPGTFEQDKFKGYHSVGVNRLSIGVQSFNNQHLEQLGRIHSAEQAIAAINAARKSGFDNFNIDLMHGLPAQTTAQAMADLKQAIDLSPTHISWYQLTIEPNTEFYNKPPKLPADIILETIQDHGHQLLLDNGYHQYEVSAFCRNNHQSVHNLNYWEFGDYIGIGAGAHGKITLPSEQRIIRTAKTRSPSDYLAREHSYTASCKNISADELPLEFMMNALRLNRGIPVNIFHERTGINIKNITNDLTKLKEMALIEDSHDRIVTTKKGHQFLNSVLEIFNG